MAIGLWGDSCWGITRMQSHFNAIDVHFPSEAHPPIWPAGSCPDTGSHRAIRLMWSNDRGRALKKYAKCKTALWNTHSHWAKVILLLQSARKWLNQKPNQSLILPISTALLLAAGFQYTRLGLTQQTMVIEYQTWAGHCWCDRSSSSVNSLAATLRNLPWYLFSYALCKSTTTLQRPRFPELRHQCFLAASHLYQFPFSFDFGQFYISN